MAATCDNILCNYRCHGEKLKTMGLCLTERTKEAQSDAPSITFDTTRLTNLIFGTVKYL